MTAVYVISPHDDISVFREKRKAVMRRSGSLTAYLDSVGTPPTVVVTGIDSEKLNIALKKLGGDSLQTKALDEFHRKVSEALLLLGIPCGDMHIFAHFGGQGPDEVEEFNKVLNRLCAENESFSCHAISFGNKKPESLFPNNRFSPPDGAAFESMCQNLQCGNVKDFVHLRVLRLLLSAKQANKDGLFDGYGICRMLEGIFGGRFEGIVEPYEREFLCKDENAMRILHIKTKKSPVYIPNALSSEEYVHLMKHLEMKGAES